MLSPIFRAVFLDHIVLTQVLLFALISIGLWLAECVIAGHRPGLKLRHTLVNYGFIFTALPIQLLLTGLMLGVSHWATVREWGVVYWIPGHQSFVVRALVGFLLLDLGDYFYHVAMHRWAPLWRFHLVHHCDPMMDVSTTTREHPCETVFRVCMTIVWVFIAGASFGVLVLRQTIGSMVNILSHTSIELPAVLERFLSWFLITPQLHHTHHHYRLPYTNSNYGDVLSIWDRLFGTYRCLATEDTVYGVDTHMRVRADSSFVEVLRLPFEGTDLAVAERKTAKGAPLPAPMIQRKAHEVNEAEDGELDLQGEVV